MGAKYGPETEIGYNRVPGNDESGATDNFFGSDGGGQRRYAAKPRRRAAIAGAKIERVAETLRKWK